MLSNPTSSIDQRRKTHRRQNSTPTLEVTNVRPFPAPIQRATAQRGHRRGLSLDQHISFQPRERMVPTLGPIAQDDTSANLTYTGQQHQYQHPLQVAQQHSMAQPGQPRFKWEPQEHHYSHQQHPSLSVDTGLLTHSPEHPSTPSMEMHHLLPSPQTPHRQQFTPSPQMNQSSQFVSGPALHGHCEEAVQKLKESVEAVYGVGSNVFINILPTPVATPQKRELTAPLHHADTAPIPLDFTNDGLGLDFKDANNSQNFEFDNSPEGSYYSPGAGSPSRSPYCSPQQQVMHSFMEEPAPQLNFDDHHLLGSPHFHSSQATLADVEPMYSPRPGSSSPHRSPTREMSIADLSLDAVVEETGISAEEVATLIEHDSNTNTFRCLFDGCGKKGFQRRENVRSHVQTHLGDRQYRCMHCSKTFVRPHDLKRHSKIHSGLKPYQCPCGQEFVRQDALTRHRQRGSCAGAFPDAVPRAPARRGRPRKTRPDMDDRLDKANRTRRLNANRHRRTDSDSSGSGSSGGSGSEGEMSRSASPAIAGAKFEFATLDTSRLGDFIEDIEEEDEQPNVEHVDNEPFSFESVDSSSACDYSSPFDSGDTSGLMDASEMIFQLSSSSTTAPTPPDSPNMKAHPFIMSDLAAMSNGGEDVFFGANDMKDSSAFWL